MDDGVFVRERAPTARCELASSAARGAAGALRGLRRSNRASPCRLACAAARIRLIRTLFFSAILLLLPTVLLSAAGFVTAGAIRKDCLQHSGWDREVFFVAARVLDG